MSAQRIKGQETKVIIMAGGNLQAELTDIKSFNITLDTELLSQGYLGMTTDLYDEIFKGAKFDLELDNHSQDVLLLNQAIIDRARRKTPDVVFNIITELQFPNGQTPVVTLPDVKFGPQPLGASGRAEFVKSKFEGACSEPDIQTS